MENFDQYYRSYKYMQKHLATDFTANYLTANMVDNDKGEDVLSGKLHEKVIDMEWVTAIEDTLPYIEKAIDEQRRFIVENNEVYRIDKAKIINKDSVKHSFLLGDLRLLFFYDPFELGNLRFELSLDLLELCDLSLKRRKQALESLRFCTISHKEAARPLLEFISTEVKL